MARHPVPRHQLGERGPVGPALDPADTYYAYAWNFVRLYGRSLMMFKSAPGADGATLVPDLAESAGTTPAGE